MGMLEIRNLSAGYGKKQVLNGITLSLPRGKLVSVAGPNGSGKSTLLKSVIRLISRSGGEIRINGTDADALSQKELARRIAYLPQGRRVPDMTAAELVLHGRFPHMSYPRRYTAEDRRIALEAMERLGLSSLADEKLSALSGGMRQSVYIAMALAQETDYILLDEPTSYLDIAHQMHLMRTLRCLSVEGKGIAAVMHDLPLAFTFSDFICVIADGRLVLNGTPEEVAASPVIREIFGVELTRDPADGSYRYQYGKKHL